MPGFSMNARTDSWRTVGRVAISPLSGTRRMGAESTFCRQSPAVGGTSPVVNPCATSSWPDTRCLS